MTDKPDGYVAVLNEGLFAYCIRVYSSWRDAAISADIDGTIFQPNDIKESLDVVACKLADIGWHIRPVKLVFLDEDKKDDR